MKKIIGLAILATFFATPAFASEVFVRNSWTDSHTHTKTDLHLKSTTHSTRNEDYHSWADKIYLDGEYTQNKKPSWGSTTVSYDNFTVHSAGSYLEGNFHETSVDKITGKINTITNSYTNSHETSAGVR